MAAHEQFIKFNCKPGFACNLMIILSHLQTAKKRSTSKRKRTGLAFDASRFLLDLILARERKNP